MKYLFTLSIVLFSLNVSGQYTTLTNFTGTATYGSRTCTVTSTGSVFTWVDVCLGAPTLYWAGYSGLPGTYIYNFSAPVYTIKVDCDYINAGAYGAGEYIQMFINGVFYPLTPANMSSYSVCGSGGGPSYLYTGFLMGPTPAGFDYNGGTFTISECTGINSFAIYCNGIEGGVTWHVGFDSVRPPVCVHAWNNGPCANDTLFLDMIGDSTGATYSWTGPHGFTSTMQMPPYFYPATYADTGVYTCIRNVGGILDTSSTHVVIYFSPVVSLSSNAPLCTGMTDTLTLSALPDSVGEIFTWTGPNSFSSTLELPTIPGFSIADSGVYKVVATTIHGCKDSGTIDVGLVAPPLAPVINGLSTYCQGTAFSPFTLTGLGIGGRGLWYPTGSGGTGSFTPSVVSTAIPGYYTVFASQIIGSCESPRDSFTVHVITTPPAPGVTGPVQYCQFIGPFVPLTVSHTVSGIAQWYTVASGGVGTGTEPAVNIAVAGTYNFWVSQIDSGCEGPRTPVTINVYAKPHPPVVTRQGPYCQFQLAEPLVAAASGTGDFLTWFGRGIPAAGTPLIPVPQADTAEVDSFYVNETSVNGCISDKALDTIRIIPKPATPQVTDTTYCQTFPAVPLNYGVDSVRGSHLNWYQSSVPVRTPVPSTAIPGTATWYVSQTVNTCQGDSVAIHVTTIYLPKFTITASSPWVCDLDSMALSYTGTGTALQDGAFLWTLPPGDSFTIHSHATDSSVLVKFDSSSQHTYVYLKASDNKGRCFTTDTLQVKVVPQPTAVSFTRADVCLGDTVSLSINTKTANSATFIWHVDYTALLGNTTALNVISANSNSGGPFSISWVDTGQHVIQLNSFTEEGCTSVATYDTVSVHTPPDASFKILAMTGGTLCIEDSVQFGANTNNYNYSYLWSPAHAFTNIDKPAAWGKVEQSQSIITLTVTDPFGCAASASMQLDPGSCCTVNFPNAFTPNGDGHNDYFRPLFPGYQTTISSLNNMSYHTFHVFRIANRWGQTVFESSNSDLKWDGTFNGVPQDMGVYYYYIKYDCGGQTLEQSGDVTLIR